MSKLMPTEVQVDALNLRLVFLADRLWSAAEAQAVARTFIGLKRLKRTKKPRRIEVLMTPGTDLPGRLPLR